MPVDYNSRINTPRSTRLRRLIGYIYVSLYLVACSEDIELRPFTSDGCTLFPDSSPLNQEQWCDCCFEHDLAYWRGGTADEREAADLRLMACVREKTGDNFLATGMYEGVRFGGSPYFYNWYRWGYGWSYERKYQRLSAEEEQIADRLEQQYFDSGESKICAF